MCLCVLVGVGVTGLSGSGVGLGVGLGSGFLGCDLGSGLGSDPGVGITTAYGTWIPITPFSGKLVISSLVNGITLILPFSPLTIRACSLSCLPVLSVMINLPLGSMV